MESSTTANTVLYTIAWALLLVFLAWPLAWFCVSCWIFLLPFEGLVLVLFKSDVVYAVAEFLESVVKWPRVIGKAICTGSDAFPTPSMEHESAERISTSDFTMTKILWTIVWSLLLIFVAWPIAYFLGWWWVVIMAFEPMIEALADVDSILESLITWPRVLMKAALTQHEHFPSPFATQDSSHQISMDYHEHNQKHEKKHEGNELVVI